MQSEDQYIDRTPDLVAKVRAMREVAQKEMNRFTRVSDYDVRRVVGHGPKPAPPVSAETVASPATTERTKKATAKAASGQAALEFTLAPAQSGEDGEPA
jgi:hypothetical protein